MALDTKTSLPLFLAALLITPVGLSGCYDFAGPRDDDDSGRDDYVNVVVPQGAAIELDGSPVSGFSAIGSTGYEVARVSLDAGSHHIESATGVTFGITTYGYANYTSYLYPGGLNFTRGGP